MAKDRREDAGQFYPGGSVVPRGPVTPGGGTPADYSTVRTNAETGAAHAAKRGYAHTASDKNPHAMTAANIPFNESSTPDSVADIIEGNHDEFTNHRDNKNNPHATTADQVGAYTKTETDNIVGRYRGKADGHYPPSIHLNLGRAGYATVYLTDTGIYKSESKTGDWYTFDIDTLLLVKNHGDEGEIASATVEMIDEQFDEEAHECVAIYSCDFADVEIHRAQAYDAKTLGGKSPDKFQQKLTTAQLANIDAVPQKRDKKDMFTEWVFSGSDWSEHYRAEIDIHKVNESTTACMVQVFDGEEVVMAAGGGVESPDVLKIDFSDENWFDPTIGITATRQRILTTADVTDDLANPTAGKAAEAKKVADALAGKATVAHWYKGAWDDISQRALGVIGNKFDGDAVGYLNGRFVNVKFVKYGDNLSWTLEGVNTPFEAKYPDYEIEDAMVGKAADLGIGVFTACGLTSEAVAALNIPTDDHINTLAEASIKDKAMPTEDAVEGSVSAKITALETAITGVAADLAAAIGEEA